MKAITPTHYALECNLNWLPVPRNLTQNTRRSPARGNERASGDETNVLYACGFNAGRGYRLGGAICSTLYVE